MSGRFDARLMSWYHSDMTNERIERLRQLIDNDADFPARERIFIITVQDYITDTQVGSPRLVDWCEESSLAATMIKVADASAALDQNVLVGCIDARWASDDDWREVCDQMELDYDIARAKDPSSWIQFDDDGAAVPSRSGQQKEFEWENIALNPDILECHPAQPAGDATDICETCGGSGVVKHPYIKNYFGDCPDCGTDDVLLM